MGPLAQFILALTNLVRSGAIRKIPDAIKFAEQQFGKVTPLLRKQIENVFSKIKKPEIGKPGKKEGTLLPFIKDKAPGEEGGLGSLDKSNIPEYDPDTRAQFEKDVEEAGGMEKFMDENPIEDMRLSDDDPMGDLEKILNPRRLGGGLDPVTGLTRALVRKILDRKGIEIGKKDPINVFTDTFGEAISDVNNLAEEMLEIDRRGGGIKDLDQMLEKDGLFDIEIPTNPQKGLTDDELLELIKKTDEEKILTDFDPKDRKPSAEGGLMRTSYAVGTGLKLAVLLARKGKNLKEEIRKMIDNIFPSGDSKYDADVVLDNVLEDLNIDRDAVDGYDISKAYGEAYDMLTAKKGLASKKVPGGMKPDDVDISQGMIDLDELNFTSNAKAAKKAIDNTSDADLLIKKYPGMSRELAEQIANDPNPERKAQVLAMVEQTFELNKQGKSGDEIIDIFKQGTDRTKQATGGRVRAASGGLARILNL